MTAEHTLTFGELNAKIKAKFDSLSNKIKELSEKVLTSPIKSDCSLTTTVTTDEFSLTSNKTKEEIFNIKTSVGELDFSKPLNSFLDMIISGNIEAGVDTIKTSGEDLYNFLVNTANKDEVIEGIKNGIMKLVKSGVSLNAIKTKISLFGEEVGKIALTTEEKAVIKTLIDPIKEAVEKNSKEEKLSLSEEIENREE